MRPFVERVFFSDSDIESHRLACGFVRRLPSHLDRGGREIRCHEVARAVARRFAALGREVVVVDGQLGGMGGIDHTWLVLPDRARTGRILDVYTPGRLPQVQLLHVHRRITSEYVPGVPRRDVLEDVVEDLSLLMVRRLDVQRVDFDLSIAAGGQVTERAPLPSSEGYHAVRVAITTAEYLSAAVYIEDLQIGDLPIVEGGVPASAFTSIHDYHGLRLSDAWVVLPKYVGGESASVSIRARNGGVLSHSLRVACELTGDVSSRKGPKLVSPIRSGVLPDLWNPGGSLLESEASR